MRGRIVISDFRILGQLEVLQDGVPVDLGTPRQRALLARLLINRLHVVTADRLIEDLWPGDPPDTARHALHVYISGLRKRLGPDRVRLERRGIGYRIDVAERELDSSRFERLASLGRTARSRGDSATASTVLNDALDIWRGPALTEFADDPFAREEALRLEELRLSSIEERIWADLELGRHAELVEDLEQLVADHPFRETFWEQLMLALYCSNRQVDALRCYQRARTRLADELGIEPGPALRLMEEKILTQDPGLQPVPGRFDVSIASTLPPQRTSFVGRRRELELATEVLEGSRLLTLTGPAGVGKTRMAIRLAADRHDHFHDGSIFVPLAAVTSPRYVEVAIARALGLREVAEESPLDGVIAFFRDRHALLVLDNFEQVIGAAPQLGELLDGAPSIKIIVTSRSRLHLAGEQEFPIPPLRIPPLGALPGPESLGAFDAVALFLARARSSLPDFALDSENAAVIAAITARVDGLPLAIELAAARLKLLPPQDLLERLDEALAVLTDGPDDGDTRHHTMRDAIAWSYELLDPEEQELFRRLAVFRQGFALEAAEDVAGLPDLDILDAVSSLLSKSLLYRPIDSGLARFAMLEMIREFGLEQLALVDDVDEVTGRHAAYFLRLARKMEPRLVREPRGGAIDRLASEIDNLRAALHYAVRTDPDLGLDLASCIWRYWQNSDQLTEGREWLNDLLAHPDASATARAKGMTALAGLAYWQADYDDALARYAEALDIYRDHGDRYNEADTLCSMALTALWKRDLETGDQLALEALPIFEDLGAREEIGLVLQAQATALWWGGDPAAAIEPWKETLAISREYGNQTRALTQLVGLAALTFHLGDRREALRIVMDGIEEAVDSQNVHTAVWMLDLVAAFVAPDAPLDAVRLAGGVDALRRQAGGGMRLESLNIEDARSVAGSALNVEQITEEWATGRSMTLEQAVERARLLAHLYSSGDPSGKTT
ncbi:MAG: BTAD domain-containing putative transcriptional regulator [Actinomycetota bacterium]